MLYDKVSNLVHCVNCNIWIYREELYLPDGFENEGRVNHLECDTTVGYTWDPEWLRMIGLD